MVERQGRQHGGVEQQASRLQADLAEPGAEGVIGFQGFLWTDRVQQDVPIGPGNRYRAGIPVLNRINNQSRRAWSDQAFARLAVSCDEEMRMVKTRIRSDDWQNIHLAFTAPASGQTARFELSVRHWLDDKEVRFARPFLECTSE